MSLLSLFLIAVGVSADAFAVSVAKGLQLRRVRPADAVLLALTFGAFQAVMPLVGWLLGSSVAGIVSEVDHWVAFALLGGIGLTMIRAAIVADAAPGERLDGIPARQLLLLGLATSIDALAVGIGLAFLEVSILGAVLLIGCVTFASTLVGVYLGHRAGQGLRRPAEGIGGLILILIGTRVVLEHTGVL